MKIPTEKDWTEYRAGGFTSDNSFLRQISSLIGIVAVLGTVFVVTAGLLNLLGVTLQTWMLLLLGLAGLFVISWGAFLLAYYRMG
jgi:hypothetical protein